jgi:uncharacterized membrane protein
LALSWALLLPYYDKNAHMTSELLAAYGGFLLVYIGGLLALEASHLQPRTTRDTVDVIQSVGLWLFLLIASPTVLSLASPNGGGFAFTRPQQEIFVATVLDVVGYVSVTYGFWRLCGRRPGIVLAVFLGIYSAAEIVYTIVCWPASDGASPPMPDHLRVVFGIAKVFFTSLFCYCISCGTMTEEERMKGFGHWVLRLLGFKAAVAAMTVPQQPPPPPAQQP